MKKIWIIALIVLVLVGAYAVYTRNANGGLEDAQPQVTAQPAQTEAPQATEEPQAGGEALDGALVEPLSEDGQNATDAQQEVFTLTGQITEVGEGYLILEDAQQGQVHVNFAEDTVYEGIEQNALAVGQYAVVLYNGVMTRSLPPMVTAMRISVYEISGTVAQVQEDGRVLIDRADVNDQVLVTLPEGAQTPEVGDEIVVYTTGIMTMSLPPQTHAIGVK